MDVQSASDLARRMGRGWVAEEKFDGVYHAVKGPARLRYSGEVYILVIEIKTVAGSTLTFTEVDEDDPERLLNFTIGKARRGLERLTEHLKELDE